jgi:hypothetical protein
MRLNALFRLAFAPAPPHGLTLPHTVTRRLILQKARHRGPRRDDTLTVCKPTVSGTISLSVAKEYLGLRGGPRRFTPVFTVPALLGIQRRRLQCFEYGAVTHYGRPFQNRSSTQQLGNFVIDLMLDLRRPTTPHRQRHQAWHRHGLASSLFARRY